MKKAFLFLAKGFEEIEAISVIDVLRRAGVKTFTVSITSDNIVIGAHSIAVNADLLLNDTDFGDADLLILPGGQPGTDNLNANEELKYQLRTHYEQGKLLAAICAAPLVLGEMGLLDGKRAVCYPGYEDRLTGATLATSERVVVSGNIITSKAPGTAIEFGLKLTELLVGKATADKLRADMIVD